MKPGNPSALAREFLERGRCESCPILDVHGLRIDDPVRLETHINQIAGVVTNGLFARRGADVLLLGTSAGVRESRRV